MSNAETSIRDVMAGLPDLLAARPFLTWRGRRFDSDVCIEAGTLPFYLRCRGGRIDSLEEGPVLMRSWDFALKAGLEAWLLHWRPVPPPGYHDIFAMAKGGHLRMEGNLHPLMTHLQFVKDLLALPRGTGGGAP